jgi:hypothetical protein
VDPLQVGVVRTPATSNQPDRHRQQAFGRWGEAFGDVVAAMIDRLVRHADVVALKGDSYRLSADRDLVLAFAANSDEQ